MQGELGALAGELRGQLLGWRRRTIELEELQGLAAGQEYEVFACAVRELVGCGVLVPVAAAGVDFSGLGRRFRLGRQALVADWALQVQREARERRLSSRLALGWYYTQAESVWREELPLLMMLSSWLDGRRELREYRPEAGCGLGGPSSDPLREPPSPWGGPKDAEAAGERRELEAGGVSLQQRSYDIFRDEKLLLERGELLAHVGLSKEALGIVEEPEPLMLAVNGAGLQGAVCHHLVVENKAPFVRLLPLLAESGFGSLVLGYGWKVAGNLQLLPRQCGRPDARHVCWYFGDFDWEGLAIWDSLQRNMTGVEVRLAVPFYRAFLQHEASLGKLAQTVQPEALERFCECFSAEEAGRWRAVLAQGGYYPQEALGAEELEKAWGEIAQLADVPFRWADR